MRAVPVPPRRLLGFRLAIHPARSRATMADHTIILIFWTGASRRTP